jgi:hypothetical protein
MEKHCLSDAATIRVDRQEWHIYPRSFSFNLKLAHSNSSNSPLDYTRSSQQSIAYNAFDQLHIVCLGGSGDSDRLRQGLGLTCLYCALPIPSADSSGQEATPVSAIGSKPSPFLNADLIQANSPSPMDPQSTTTRLTSSPSSNKVHSLRYTSPFVSTC